MIAHRLQTARTADRIVVLDGGRIIEAGPHKDLLAAGGKYASMWEAFETASHAAATPAAPGTWGRAAVCRSAGNAA